MSFRTLAPLAVFALLSLGAVVAGADPVSTKAAPPKVGEQAQGFELADLKGGKVSLDEVRKTRPVVLLVLRGWPGYQCPLCTKQVGEFLSKAKQFDEAGATVVMVYPGPAADLDEHAKEFVEGTNFPANFRFVVDPDYEMVGRYGLRWDAPNETAYPSTFVIDADGKIVFARISDDHGGRTSAAEALKALPKK